jgi:hypothetical protein
VNSEVLSSGILSLTSLSQAELQKLTISDLSQTSPFSHLPSPISHLPSDHLISLPTQREEKSRDVRTYVHEKGLLLCYLLLATVQA